METCKSHAATHRGQSAQQNGQEELQQDERADEDGDDKIDGDPGCDGLQSGCGEKQSRRRRGQIRLGGVSAVVSVCLRQAVHSPACPEEAAGRVNSLG